MNSISFDFTHSCISRKQIEQTSIHLDSTIRFVTTHHSNQGLYTTPYCSVNLPTDAHLIKTINDLIKEKKQINPTMLIVIGIGGSNLGTIALLEGIYGKFYNDSIHLKTYFIDSVDSDYNTTIMHYAQEHLNAGRNLLINVISKSGTTTETVINFRIFFNLVRQYYPDTYNKFIVITTDKNSQLWKFGTNHSIALLEIPLLVGGRYSVFSAVGLFPLALCGINIQELVNGARSALPTMTVKNISNNNAIKSAVILYELYKKKYIVHDTFIFSTQLEALGKWYRQLLAESIGKSHDNNGLLINNGILPTVSIGSTDLHSVAQLYLSGPYAIYTAFVSVEKKNNDVTIKNDKIFNDFAAQLNNKSIHTIMSAVLGGTMAAYQKNKRPFSWIKIPEKTAYYLGQYMQIKMLEVMYLGTLMNINAFDQPNVELYKQETTRILNQI